MIFQIIPKAGDYNGPIQKVEDFFNIFPIVFRFQALYTS